MAEWLGSGLQNHLQRFESARDLFNSFLVSFFQKSISNNKSLIFLILANVVLRLVFITSRDIAHDEPFSISKSLMSFAQMWEFFKNENNPPLHFWLLKIWGDVFGISAFSLRFMSVVFSVITVMYIYFIGRDFFNEKIGLIAGMLFVFSSEVAFHSIEVRAYALLVMLVVMSQYYFWQMSRMSDSNKKHIFLLGLINAAIAYTHFTGLLYLVFQFLSFLVFYRRSITKNYLISIMVTVAFFVPYLPIFLSRFFSTSSQGTWVTFSGEIEEIYNMFRVLLNEVICVLLFFAAILCFIFLRLKKHVIYNTKFAESCFAACVGFFGVFLISYKIPMYLPRYVFVFAPFLYIVYAYMLYQISFFIQYKWIRNLVVFLPIGCAIATLKYSPSNKYSIKSSVEFIKEHAVANQLTVVSTEGDNIGFMYYYDKPRFDSLSRDGVNVATDYENVIFRKADFFKNDKENIRSDIKNIVVFNDIRPTGTFYGFKLIEAREDDKLYFYSK